MTVRLTRLAAAAVVAAGIVGFGPSAPADAAQTCVQADAAVSPTNVGVPTACAGPMDWPSECASAPVNYVLFVDMSGSVCVATPADGVPPTPLVPFILSL